jgi:molybdate transport system substrate-binding protein
MPLAFASIKTRSKCCSKIAALVSVLILVVHLAFASVASSQELRIAAAADLKFAMDDLVGQYEKQSRTKVSVTYGSSGNLFSQLENGAPFDLFFSADSEYVKKLEAAGFAEPGTARLYAIGLIVIWTPADSKVDVPGQGWKALLNPAVEKIAVANPDHAPYGRAAISALQKAGIYDAVKSKLVYGENISQAAQFVQSGTAHAGIIALSLAKSPAMRDGQRWDIPANLYAPLEQTAVVLKSSANKTAARAFLDFVLSPAGRGTLAKYGFTFPKMLPAAK